MAITAQYGFGMDETLTPSFKSTDPLPQTLLPHSDRAGEMRLAAS